VSFAVRQITATAITGGSAQTISPATDPGLGAPKAALMFGIALNNDAGVAVHNRAFVGAACPDGTDGCATFAADDNVGTMIGGGRTEMDAALKIDLQATTPTLDAVATVTAWNSDGSIDLTWSDLPSLAFRVQVVLFYGSDITNATVRQVTTPASAGSHSHTGMAFSPDVVMRFGTAQTNLGTRANGAHFHWSLFTDSEQAAGGILVAETTTAQNCVAQRSDRSFWTPNAAGANLWDATLTSINSDGWTESYNVSAGSSNCWALCLEGPRVYVGAETAPTSVQTKSTTAPGFNPAGAVLFSWNQVASTAVDSSSTQCAMMAIGAADSEGAEASVWWGHDDSPTTSDANMRHTNAKALQLCSDFAGTVEGAADWSDTATGFDLAWNPAPATAREFVYVVFGGLAGTKQVSPAVGAAATVGITVRRRRRVQPAAAAASTVTAAPRRRRRVTAGVSASAAVSATVRRRRRVQAAVTSQSAVQALPRRRRRVQASVAAASSVAAAPRRRRRVQLVVAAASTVTVTAQVLSPVKQITVGVAAASSVTAAVRRRRRVTASVAAVSTVSVAVRRRKSATGLLVAATSSVTVTGARRRRRVAMGVVGASSVTVAQLRRRRRVAVAVAGSSSVAVTTRRRRRVAVTVAGSSSVAVTTRRRRRITAGVSALSTVQALPRRQPKQITVGVAGSSSVTALPRRRRRITPAVLAASSVAVTGARRRRQLAVAVTCTSTVSVVASAGVTTLPSIAVGSYP
jgi:hypothetical protein